MAMFSTHYIDETLCVDKNYASSKVMVDKIYKVANGKIPVFIFTGMSGVSIATAVSILYYQKFKVKTPLFYVRKNHEKNHSCRSYEASYFDEFTMRTSKRYAFFFIDDFISSGQTLVNCVNEFSKIRELASINCVVAKKEYKGCFPYKSITYNIGGSEDKKKRLNLKFI